MYSGALDTPIEYLKGVGPQKGEMLKKELSLFTFNDLIHHFPYKYIDRSKIYTISEINCNMPYVQLKGKITHMEVVGQHRKKRLIARFTDHTGAIELIWFQGAGWVAQQIKAGEDYLILGKPSAYKNKISIAHPEMESLSDNMNKHYNSSFKAMYHTTEKLKSRGIDSKTINRLIETLINQYWQPVNENLPSDILLKYQLPTRNEALINIHMPVSSTLLSQSRLRLKFEELFYMQLSLLLLKQNRNRKIKGHKFNIVGKHFNNFYKDCLPFELTNAQKRVLKEIRIDTGSGVQMNRLLQGDVGSGKTLVALMTMLIAIDNNYQTCLMAPTEILATQHYHTLKDLLRQMELEVCLLTGSTPAKERKQIFSDLLNNKIHILIGTHALIEEQVQFNNLGLVVIDEQHRFGVAQRARLWKKNKIPAHILIMSATPIPRTLAMTLYGDLEVSVIDEMPPGRKPIKTIHAYDSKRLRIFGFLKEQITLGRQVYIVYPLIKESEKLDYNNLMEGYESISRAFPLPEYKVSIVHGQMKPADKEFEMQRFVERKTQIMIATTVIEVGVNIPNASVMVIESAERFGLSQLHQLRGRVGRGSFESYCVLMTSNKLSTEARTRLEAMVKTNDGFEISDIDLRLRGPGDISGTRQSGLLDLKIANLSTDAQILQWARNAAQEILKNDPELQTKKNAPVINYYNSQIKSKMNWSLIS